MYDKWLGGGGGASDILPVTTPVTIAANATLDLSGDNQTVFSLAGGGSVINSDSGSATVLTVSPTAGSTIFSGVIEGGGTLGTISLVKAGAGGLILTGNNLYTGGTTVSGGTLALGNGGTSGEILGPVVLSNHSALVFDRANDVDFTASISGTGSLTKEGAGTLTLEGTNSYTDGTSVLGGTLLITSAIALPNGTSLTVGAGGTFIFDPSAAGSPVAGGSVAAVAPVPEPGTLALLAAALGSAVACRRFLRRRGKAI